MESALAIDWSQLATKKVESTLKARMEYDQSLDSWTKLEYEVGLDWQCKTESRCSS
uniref:Uncharacterized protein n=1 Tax=Rhizophora mucronata TaxID=61149 RepID=A0A2P2PI14_RHIMU